jgi:hypothetical protein
MPGVSVLAMDILLDQKSRRGRVRPLVPSQNSDNLVYRGRRRSKEVGSYRLRGCQRADFRTPDLSRARNATSQERQLEGAV